MKNKLIILLLLLLTGSIKTNAQDYHKLLDTGKIWYTVQIDISQGSCGRVNKVVDYLYNLPCSDIITSHGKSVNSSYFANDSQWHYTNREGSETPNTGYLLQVVEKDTSVLGFICQKITREVYHSDESVEVLAPIITYTEGSKVYYLLNNKFYILYDSSVSSGDTITMREPYYTGYSIDTTFQVAIDSVKFEMVNGNNLKIIYQHAVFNGSGWSFDGRVIEGIGCLDSFLPYNQLDCDQGLCFSPIRCYENNLFGLIQFSEVDCNSLITSVELNENKKLKIYPNPAFSYVKIDSSEKIRKINPTWLLHAQK